ncbi:MAG: site-2 protease family protein [Acidobacteria bacterium]|nr:site-2 protease family protein [Acidobacteriota bacterium]
MRSQIKLGRIAGIEIGLNYSWFLIAMLIAFSLAAHFGNIRHDWSRGTVWLAAAAVLFFVSLLVHELAHLLVAKSRGLKVRAITLFALGGVSQIESEARDPRSQFAIAIAGPLASLVIGLISSWVARASNWTPSQEAPSPAIAVLAWLGYLNVALAVFNVIPGYPLDGGRILRSILWRTSGRIDRASRWASAVGQVVAFLFILLGLVRFFVGANFGGLWLAFIGWFLLDAAKNSYLESAIGSRLRDRRVSDLMERDYARVEGSTNLRGFVDQYLLHTGSRCFVVMESNNAVGILTPDEVKSVNRENWGRTSIDGIMRPLNQMRSMPPETPVEGLELMRREHIDQLPIISNGRLEGDILARPGGAFSSNGFWTGGCGLIHHA